jgi:hypothetical protein
MRVRHGEEKPQDDVERNLKPFRPALGRDFTGLTDIAARDKYETSRTRDRIAYIFLGTLICALAIATIYGFMTDSFRALEHVWSVAGPFAGAIAAFYFHRERRDSG